MPNLTTVKRLDIFRLKRIIIVRDSAYCEKFQPISLLIKKALQTTNQARINRAFLLAFPNATIKKAHDGRLVTGVGLAPGYQQVPAPVFTDEDFCGDFTEVDMNESQEEEDESNNTLDITGTLFS